MGSVCHYSINISLCIHKYILFMFIFISISNAKVQTQTNQSTIEHSVSALLVFGDSTVDPGNNNYIPTIAKSNFPPYGRDFVNHVPTGRFSNGRLVTDFVASYIGVKDFVPPYLDPSLSLEELTTGVSFASADSGFDPVTALLSGVISLQKQVEYFREYKTRLEVTMGREGAKNLINKALFVVSAGTNDFVVNYFGPPIRRQSYSVSSYQQLLRENIHRFLQDLLNEGATNIAVVGVPPMGCLPSVITLFSRNVTGYGRQCIEELCSIAKDYNRMLQKELNSMQRRDINMFYADIYTPFNNIIKRRKFFGFDEANTGCCATGLFESSIFCNPSSPVCSDPSKYVFWDAVHPTERAYYIMFKTLRPIIDQALKKIIS